MARSAGGGRTEEIRHARFGNGNAGVAADQLSAGHGLLAAVALDLEPHPRHPLEPLAEAPPSATSFSIPSPIRKSGSPRGAFAPRSRPGVVWPRSARRTGNQLFFQPPSRKMTAPYLRQVLCGDADFAVASTFLSPTPRICSSLRVPASVRRGRG